MIYTGKQQHRRSASFRYVVVEVQTYIGNQMTSPDRVGLGQQTYIDPVLPVEVTQFLLPTAKTVCIAGDRSQHFEHSPRKSWPKEKGWDGCEEPLSKFHTFVKG